MKTKEKGRKANRKTILKRAGLLLALLFFVIAAAGAMFCSGCQQDERAVWNEDNCKWKSMRGKTAKEAAKNLMRNFRNIRYIRENGEEIYRLSLGEAGYSDTQALTQA